MDIALRNGSPTKDSCNDIEGIKESYTLQQFKYRENMGKGEIPLDFERHLRKMADFSIKKYNDNKNGKYEKDDNFNYERLEDIKQEDIIRFTKYQIIGVKTNSANSVKSDYWDYQVERQFASGNDDDEEMKTGSALASYDNSVSLFYEEKAKERIPYLLKHLHEYSKHLGYSLISVIIAYDEVINSNVNTNRQPAPRQLLETGKMYAMNKDGTLGERYHTNQHDASHAMKWIRGYEPDLYYEYARELMKITEDIGYPMKDEDPLEYNEQFFQDLVITYVEKNRTYLEHMSSDRLFNRRILKSIGEIDINEYKKKIDIKDDDSVTLETMSLQQQILHTVQLFELSPPPGFYFGFNPELQSYLKRFCTKQAKYYGTLKQFDLAKEYIQRQKVLSRKGYSSGFLASNNTDFEVFDLTHISDKRSFALLHNSGYFVEIRNDYNIRLMSIAEAEQSVEALNESFTNNRDPKDIYSKFKVWS